MSCVCKTCGKTMADEQFYTSKNLEKYPNNGKLDICKNCITMHIDNWNPDTYTWILKEIDVPYIKEKWDELLRKKAPNEEAARKLTGKSILGQYLSMMKLVQFRDCRWEDTERIAEESRKEKENVLKAQGLSDEEIQQQLAIDHAPKKFTFKQNVDEPLQYEETEEDKFVSQIDDELTDEDKKMLQLKWGRGYTWAQRVRMEQLYQDFMNSYDIRGAGMKDNLILICKTSLKTNELLDCGDIEGSQKTAKMYNDIMKAAKLTAAQLKADDSDEIDSVGELIALCEKEEFIPRYYVTTPRDHVDRTLQDMQKYTSDLISNEYNLSNLIESVAKDIESDRVKEAQIETDDDLSEDEKLEMMLFGQDDEEQETTDEDFRDFEKLKEELAEMDDRLV